MTAQTTQTVAHFLDYAHYEINDFLRGLRAQPSNSVPGIYWNIQPTEQIWDEIFNPDQFEGVTRRLRKTQYYRIHHRRDIFQLVDGEVVVDYFELFFNKGWNSYSVYAINGKIEFVLTPKMRAIMDEPVSYSAEYGVWE